MSTSVDPRGVKVVCPGCKEVSYCPHARYATDEGWAAFLNAVGLVPHGRRGGVHRTCVYLAEREGRPLESAEDVADAGPPVVPAGAKPWRAR